MDNPRDDPGEGQPVPVGGHREDLPPPYGQTDALKALVPRLTGGETDVVEGEDLPLLLQLSGVLHGALAAEQPFPGLLRRA